jgi:hypothetical protein
MGIFILKVGANIDDNLGRVNKKLPVLYFDGKLRNPPGFLSNYQRQVDQVMLPEPARVILALFKMSWPDWI